MNTPIDRLLYEGKHLYVFYSREDEQITFACPNKINKKEWRDFKKELEDVIKIEIK